MVISSTDLIGYSNRSVRWGLLWNNESTINTGDCAKLVTGLHSKWKFSARR